MRDLSTLVWGDLQTDRERAEFIQSGLAVETGILAPAMVEDLVEVYRRLQEADPDNLKQQVRNAVKRLRKLEHTDLLDSPGYAYGVITGVIDDMKKAVGDE